MRNSMKIAQWEVKRNLKNKSFIIGLLITPLIFLFFMIVPSLFGDSDEEAEYNEATIFVYDELAILPQIKEQLEKNSWNDWHVEEVTDQEEMINELPNLVDSVYIALTEDTLESGTLPIMTSGEFDDFYLADLQLITEPIQLAQLKRMNLTEEQLTIVGKGIELDIVDNPVASNEDADGVFDNLTAEDGLKQFVPGIFAGVILFSIVISGMMIFQSASQEKKDKIAEIILSSVTPNELMQGKIIGYFILGIVQVFIWAIMIVPILIWKTKLPIIEYIFVPETALLLLIALLGYLVFASLFVGIGATVEDISTAGNFQGMLFMLPFLPFIFIAPIISNPEGMVAQVTSYIPLTSPAVLLMRLTMLEEWPWVEIIIALIILVVSVIILMKLAGRIFRTGILLYGKNATPKEIWKWLWIK